MDNGFIWKGLHSKEDMNIVCESLPPKTTAQSRVRQLEIPGRSGFLTVEEEGHNSLSKTVTFHLLDETEVDIVKSWLSGTGEVIFSNQDDRYYKATIISKIDLDEIIPILHKAIVQFECQPYGYLLNGNEVITVSSNGEIVYNPGTYKSEPYIKIYGAGNVALYINDTYIYIEGIDEYVEIDTDLDVVYKGTVNMDSVSKGECPCLHPGENTITWKGTGTITKVEIIPRWRCL